MRRSSAALSGAFLSSSTKFPTDAFPGFLDELILVESFELIERAWAGDAADGGAC